jgi:hypothetical protein
VGVEETLLGFWNTVTAPIDLNELGEFTLHDCARQQKSWGVMISRSRWDRSLEQTHIEF